MYHAAMEASWELAVEKGAYQTFPGPNIVTPFGVKSTRILFLFEIASVSIDFVRWVKFVLITSCRKKPIILFIAE